MSSLSGKDPSRLQGAIEMKIASLGELLAGAAGAASSANGLGAFGAITKPTSLVGLAGLTHRQLSCAGIAEGCEDTGRPFLIGASSRSSEEARDWAWVGKDSTKADAQWLGEQLVEHALLTGYLPLPEDSVLELRSICSLAGGKEGKTVAVVWFEGLGRWVGVVRGTGTGDKVDPVMELKSALACDSAQRLAAGPAVLHVRGGKQFIRESMLLGAASHGKLEARVVATDKEGESAGVDAEYLPLFFGQGSAPDGTVAAREVGKYELSASAKHVAKSVVYLQDDAPDNQGDTSIANEQAEQADGLMQVAASMKGAGAAKASVRGYSRRVHHRRFRHSNAGRTLSSLLKDRNLHRHGDTGTSHEGQKMLHMHDPEGQTESASTLRFRGRASLLSGASRDTPGAEQGVAS